MAQSVYIETTIPSSYYDDRPQPEMQARQNWTRDWWQNYREQYSLYSSAAVIDELEGGDHPRKDEKLAMLAGVPLLEVTHDVIEVARVYIQQTVMPADPAGDALHLALASFYKIDILLTWNCQHFANENKLGHIRRTNALMGLWTPDLVTPLNLLGE